MTHSNRMQLFDNGAVDEAIAASEQAGMPAAYKQVSSCGWVFVFRIGAQANPDNQWTAGLSGNRAV